jgi:ribosomal protein S6
MEDINEFEPKLYELGFLIDPAIPEELVPAEVAKIIELVEAHKGSLEVSGTPIMRALSYTIEVAKAGKRHKYDQAHFSWVKFRMLPLQIEAFNLEVTKIPTIIRHLLVHGSLASTTPAIRRYVKKEGVPGAETVEVVKVTEAEIDKEVDALIASTDAVPMTLAK